LKTRKQDNTAIKEMFT